MKSARKNLYWWYNILLLHNYPKFETLKLYISKILYGLITASQNSKIFLCINQTWMQMQYLVSMSNTSFTFCNIGFANIFANIFRCFLLPKHFTSILTVLLGSIPFPITLEQNKITQNEISKFKFWTCVHLK